MKSEPAMVTSTVKRALATGVLVGILTSGISIAVGTLASASADSGSAVTVDAAHDSLAHDTDPMPDLAVTVSQTTGLIGQGIQVSWTGATHPSQRPQSGTGGENFLQVFQCWGEDANNPGHPDRSTCQYGGLGAAASTRDGSLASDYEIPAEDTPYVVPGAGYFSPPYASVPFVSSPNGPVPNKTIWSIKSTNGVLSQDRTVDANNNEFLNRYSTNEVTWVGSDTSGRGSVKFEIQNVATSSGLGCGAPVVVNGETKGQSCWLVILPRGSADNGEPNVSKSGLLWDSWKHHLAVKLDFKPTSQSCAIGKTERTLAGSELASQAVASWQAPFCLKAEGSPLVMSAGAETDALRKAAGTVPSSLALTTRPYAESATDTNVYAPLAVSGVAISIAIDRRVTSFGSVPAEFTERQFSPVPTIKLTPRLVAKLLTSSYRESLPSGADLAQSIGYVNSDSPGPNPRNLTKDPDFLAVNCGGSDDATLRSCEWYWQEISGVGVSDLLVPSGRSDLAWQLWSYVMADADARAYLSGTPDQWGMKVNVWYSTSATVDPNGVGMTYPRDDFPKADPSEKPNTATPSGGGSGPINLITWRPFTNDFETGAYFTLRGDPARLGAWNPYAVPAKFEKGTRDLVGDQRVLAVTTAAAAAKYQTATAELLNPAGRFVALSSDSLAAGAASLSATANGSVYSYNPAGDAARAAQSAYPLTMMVYAAVNPLQTDAALRSVYAAFIRYAAKDGQTPGTAPGQLPPGYAPLTAGMVTQALQAAASIQSGVRPQIAKSLGSAAGTSYIPTGGITSNNASAAQAAVTGTGDSITDLSSGATPADPALGVISSAIPLGTASGLAAAAAVPLYTRFRRRAPL